jgi:hypothetical protein
MVFCPVLWQVQPFFTSFSCSLPVQDGSLTACSQKDKKTNPARHSQPSWNFVLRIQIHVRNSQGKSKPPDDYSWSFNVPKMMRDAITSWSSLSEAVRCRFVKIARHKYASLSEAVRCRFVKIAKHKYTSYNGTSVQFFVTCTNFLYPSFKEAT